MTVETLLDHVGCHSEVAHHGRLQQRVQPPRRFVVLVGLVFVEYVDLSSVALVDLAEGRGAKTFGPSPSTAYGDLRVRLFGAGECRPPAQVSSAPLCKIAAVSALVGAKVVSSPPPIYLDFHATTPVDARVVEAMKPYFTEVFANPASSHPAGRAAAVAVETARREVASLLGAKPREIIFTSGATEANNLALLGAAARQGSRRRIITFASEHPAVLEPLELLAARGSDVLVLEVRGDGQPDLDDLERAVDETTLLVSVAAANHEIGAIADLQEVARIAHAAGALVHTDASQAVGKIPLDVAASGVDLLSLSAHKLYGPKGVGALFASDDVQSRLRPLMRGGGQERGLRSGTLNVPGIVGLGAAARIAQENMTEERARIRALRDLLLAHLLEGIEGLELNGGDDARLDGNLNVRLPGVEAEALIARCPQLAFSTGSACTSMTAAASHVLLAIGRTAGEAEESVRLCVGRPTTESDVEQAAAVLIPAALAIRAAQAAPGVPA